MDNSENKIEANAKKKLAIKDFKLLSTSGNLGAYKECELTHVYLVETDSKILYHYYAVLSYEEYLECNDNLKENYLVPKLIDINKKYKLGIKQSRISFDCSRNIFEQLCNNNLIINETTFLISKFFTVLPKTHIPSCWDNEPSLLLKILKSNFWGDNYIIEFFSNQNPFKGLLSNEDFVKINKNIKGNINIDLDSINDRIGSFIFQFPVTLIKANIIPMNDWCNANFSIRIYPPFDQSDNIITIINTSLDGVMTSFHNLEGIHDNHRVELGDSHNFELFIVNKQNKLLYQHFRGNYCRYFNFGGSIGIHNSEPRIFTNSDGEKIHINLFRNDLGGGKSSNGNYEERIQKRMQHNDIIKESYDFAIFHNQRKESLAYIRKLIEQNNGNISEIWLLDPYLLSRDIIDTLYYQSLFGVKLKCIASYKKSKTLLNCSESSDNIDLDYFEKYKLEQKEYILTQSNNLGIILEYRVTHEATGFAFHDRFLFFIPKDTDAIPSAYSLGTSVNSLGKAHHIIQKVPDSRKLVYTFKKLWNLLDGENNRIIKLPEERDHEK